MCCEPGISNYGAQRREMTADGGESVPNLLVPSTLIGPCQLHLFASVLAVLALFLKEVQDERGDDCGHDSADTETGKC